VSEPEASDQEQASGEVGATREHARPIPVGRESAAAMSPHRHSTSLLPIIGILLCAATPTPALAHGPGINAILLLAVLLLALPILSSVLDRRALKRWLSIELTTKAAALANLAAFIAAVIAWNWFHDLFGTITDALEPGRINAAYILREYFPYLRILFSALALVLTKALFLRWYAPLPLTLRSIGILLLSTLAAVGVVVGIGLIPTWVLA
jgi:hypothetical protein